MLNFKYLDWVKLIEIIMFTRNFPKTFIKKLSGIKWDLHIWFLHPSNSCPKIMKIFLYKFRHDNFFIEQLILSTVIGRMKICKCEILFVVKFDRNVNSIWSNITNNMMYIWLKITNSNCYYFKAWKKTSYLFPCKISGQSELESISRPYPRITSSISRM